MIRCRECIHFEEDDGDQKCNRHHFGFDPFGFDSPDEMVCDFFERYQENDDMFLDIERYDEIELFMHE